ncbi:hypothetical protein [Endozoicomonas sp. ISHI1]|uniref:hypothetical protein n=2 Tax=Endozoicomonas TaxID=305899 RepID=UPI0021498F90|nr:hypothetical protein [Endozoicomonas sp. ISHI1]
MNSSRSGFAVALLSSIFALPCHVYATDGPTGSFTYTDVYSCSELTSDDDKGVCSQHLPAFKALIREKNNQISATKPFTSVSTNASTSASTTASPSASPITETVRIRKISATTRLDHEAFRTTYPTLFIFDAERSSGKGQPAVYELPLTVAVTGPTRDVKSFQLPDNSAFVGNSINVLAEFVIEGGIQDHYVMSAPHNDSVYYLANIEINSRNPSDRGSSSATVASELPTTQMHKPSGILELEGAGIFLADNIKVVMDPAGHHKGVQPVVLGCTHFRDGRGAEEQFVYRFKDSEFYLLPGTQEEMGPLNAALNVRCYQAEGQVQLTMRNTKTIIFVPTETVTPTPGLPTGSGVLFSIFLWPRENVMRFDNSTCNTVVDQFDNDLTIGSAYPSDPDYYMGDVWGSFCTDVNMIHGAFGLKDREKAWGWFLADKDNKLSCAALLEKTYRAGFAPVSTWSKAGFDVAINCPESAIVTQIPYSIATQVYSIDVGALAVNSTERTGLTEGQKVAIGVGIAGFVVDQAITQSWFYFSKRIRQAWIRHTSQALAAALGLGIPLVQLIPCFSGLRGKSATQSLLIEPTMSELVAKQQQ